uniref:Clr5 domain-containing protein n=1 Tax=Colletotrichum fructicola (strain Nara gc5) TaxID=1213859 RepID=L2FTW4_COLFN
MSLGAQKLPRPRPGQDWDAKKDILQRLYLKENKPLGEIVGIMHHQYLFLATERMYKRQFMKWKWRKYNSEGLRQNHGGDALARSWVEDTLGGKRTVHSPYHQLVLYFSSIGQAIVLGPMYNTLVGTPSGIDAQGSTIFLSRGVILKLWHDSGHISSTSKILSAAGIYPKKPFKASKAFSTKRP